MTAKQFNKTEKKVMVTKEFGKPMYVVAAVSLLARPTLTENKDNATVWGAMDTPAKLDYHKVLVKANGLVFESVN